MHFNRMLATAAAAALMLGSSLSAEARLITDHLGRQVDVPDQINRVVTTTILPYASVTTVFLGGAAK